jgi:hypothetical protein
MRFVTVLPERRYSLRTASLIAGTVFVLSSAVSRMTFRSAAAPIRAKYAQNGLPANADRSDRARNVSSGNGCVHSVSTRSVSLWRSTRTKKVPPKS